MNRIIALILTFFATSAFAINPGETVFPDITLVSSNPSVNPTSNTWRILSGIDGDGILSFQQFNGLNWTSISKMTRSGAAGNFSSLTTSGTITSTVPTGTAPIVTASTTNVANLNASSLNGATFAAPGAIGGGTAAAGSFTTLSATGTSTSVITNNASAGASITTFGDRESRILGITSGGAGAVGAGAELVFGITDTPTKRFASVSGYITGTDGTGATGGVSITAKGATASTNPTEVARFTNTGLAVTGALSATGHLSLGGAAPTIASGDCGTTTNGSVAGTDHAGVITIGAVATTACKVTFGTAWTAAPHACVFSPASSGAAAITVLAYNSAITTTYFTISGAALASTVFNYWCE